MPGSSPSSPHIPRLPPTPRTRVPSIPLHASTASNISHVREALASTALTERSSLLPPARHHYLSLPPTTRRPYSVYYSTRLLPERLHHSPAAYSHVPVHQTIPHGHCHASVTMNPHKSKSCNAVTYFRRQNGATQTRVAGRTIPNYKHGNQPLYIYFPRIRTPSLSCFII